jgi:hypothetical protein
MMRSTRAVTFFYSIPGARFRGLVDFSAVQWELTRVSVPLVRVPPPSK